MPKKRSVWEIAILKVLEKHNGIATLKKFYEEVPPQIKKTNTTDAKHDIRGYLRRLKNVKKEIKQIGLSTYALLGVKAENVIYENIQNLNFEKEFFNIPQNRIHGYVEGMLIEIGNLKNYQTYTPDKHFIFNGEPLNDLITCEKIPEFTYQDILNIVRQIDVIWFKDRFPYLTFDIELSTQISMALVRANELRNFKVTFYVVADEKKENLFNAKSNVTTFQTIKDNTKFITIKSVFDDYRSLVLENKYKERSLMFK
jgi:hypothetical protein